MTFTILHLQQDIAVETGGKCQVAFSYIDLWKLQEVGK